MHFTTIDVIDFAAMGFMSFYKKLHPISLSNFWGAVLFFFIGKQKASKDQYHYQLLF